MEKSTEDNADQIPPQKEPDVEEEESVTINEIVESLDEMEETAEVLFGNQDPQVCTYPEGYKPRQTVFACLTCVQPPQMAGVCYGCSLNCHEGHDIIELYTKRKFQCDCGNSKFGTKKCSLYEDKDAENKYNVYNHNYVGRFCTCDVFYPDEDRDIEFYQCEVCEDWFHDDHLNSKCIKSEDQQDGESSTASQEKQRHSSLVCVSCVKKLPFLMNLPNGKGPYCHTKQPKTEQVVEPTALEIFKFRERLCKCVDCTRVYENAECDFLLEDEDDVGTYERESKKKAQEDKVTPEDEMRSLVKAYGMDNAQKIYEGVHDLKRKLGEFMNAQSGEKPISADDVKGFFATLKEERLQKRSRLE